VSPASATISGQKPVESSSIPFNSSQSLRQATISFDRSLVQEDLRRAERAAARCDLMLAVSTKPSVYPIAWRTPSCADPSARSSRPSRNDPRAWIVGAARRC